MDELYKKFLKHDMLPLGSFENNNIDKNFDWYDNEYIIKLDVDVNSKRLEADFYTLKEYISTKYVSNRQEIIEKNGVDLNTLLEIYQQHGFTKDNYACYPLNKLGSNDLLDCFDNTYTKDFFQQFIGSTHRQQYSVGQSGLNLSIHKDHENFLEHGFRMMTPVNKPNYFGFLDNNFNELFFKLDVGSVYFVNVTKFHRAFSHEANRILLRWQSNNDINIKGEIINPIDSSIISEEYRTYNFDRKFWGVTE